MKQCTSCKRTDVEFYKNKSKRDGLASECKECSKKFTTSWAKRNPEKAKAIRQRAVRNNIEQRRKVVREASRRWRANHPGAANENNRKSRLKKLESAILDLD